MVPFDAARQDTSKSAIKKIKGPGSISGRISHGNKDSWIGLKRQRETSE
jgi:hypothetical protein